MPSQCLLWSGLACFGSTRTGLASLPVHPAVAAALHATFNSPARPALRHPPRPNSPRSVVPWLVLLRCSYAFGLIMWELLTWELPFAEMSTLQVGGCWVRGWVGGLQTAQPGSCPLGLAELSTLQVGGWVLLGGRCRAWWSAVSGAQHRQGAASCTDDHTTGADLHAHAVPCLPHAVPCPLPNPPDHAGSLAPCKLHARQLHTLLCPALPPPAQIMLAVTQQGKRPPVPTQYEAAQVRCDRTKQRPASCR